MGRSLDRHIDVQLRDRRYQNFRSDTYTDSLVIRKTSIILVLAKIEIRAFLNSLDAELSYFLWTKSYSASFAPGFLTGFQ